MIEDELTPEEKAEEARFQALNEKWGAYRHPETLPVKTGIVGFRSSLPDGTPYPNAPAFIQELEEIKPVLTCSGCGCEVTWEAATKLRQAKTISVMFRQPPRHYQTISLYCQDCSLNLTPTVTKAACPSCYKEAVRTLLCSTCKEAGYPACWRCRASIKGIKPTRNTDLYINKDGSKDPNKMVCKDCGHVFASHEEIKNTHMVWD